MTVCADKTEVKNLISERLETFDGVIHSHEYLEIDTYLEHEEAFKIINHKQESAYQISIDAVLKQPLYIILQALETGEFTKCLQISRIVGYYSRVHNWNKSKKQELIQRAESRREGVGYSVENVGKIENVNETINVLNRM